MIMQEYADYLVRWLEEKRTGLYQLDGYVLGVSGGIDSAVCLHLLAQTGAPIKAFMLPAAVSREQDLADARAVLESAGVEGEVISIAPMYDAVMAGVGNALHPAPERVNVLHGNLMARLRMITLYTIAQSHRAV